MKKWWFIGGAVAGLALVLIVGLGWAHGPEVPGGARLHDGFLPPGTAFTYQGRLTKGGVPVNDTCDFQFGLWDESTDGLQIGMTQTVASVAVTDGLFTIPDLDFGGGAITGAARWIAVAVKCGSDPSYTTLAPRQALRPAPLALALPGLWTQQNAISPNLIGGYGGNSVTDGVVGATIGGGGAPGSTNRVTRDYGTVGGGFGNQSSYYATVSGGYINTASAEYTVVGGGRNNEAAGYAATVSGGWCNTVTARHATVGGGLYNDAAGLAATIGGGWGNSADGERATIGGGTLNVALGNGASVGGGGWDGTNVEGNQALAPASTIGGGLGNVISPTADYGTVGGGRENQIGPGLARGSTIAGGYRNRAGHLYVTVGGGQENDAWGQYAVIGGGHGNSAPGFGGVVSGGENNVASGGRSAVGGGSDNTASGFGSTICGGWDNEASGEFATVPGGLEADASHYGQMAYASGAFAEPGDAQVSFYVLRNTTSDSTQTELFLDGGTMDRRITIPLTSAVAFDILVVARSSGHASAGYRIEGVIENDGGTTAFIGTPTVTTLAEDRAAWDVSVEANDTYDALRILVTGEVGFTVRWVAVVRAVEVSW